MKKLARLLASLLAIMMLCSLVGCNALFEEYSEYSVIVEESDDNAAVSDQPTADPEDGAVETSDPTESNTVTDENPDNSTDITDENSGSTDEPATGETTKAPVANNTTKVPAATNAPVANNTTKVPAATNAPVANNTTKAPAATNAPVANNTTKAPATTNAPVANNTTKAPAATNAPVANNTTKVPAATNAPVANNTTKAPTATNAPVANNTTKAPVTTKAPIATQAPATTKVPVATQAPATTKAPTTRPSSNRKNNDTIRRNVTVASGASKVDTYTNTFKGKSYKSMVWTEISTMEYKNELEAFAAKYGCTIKYDQVNFESVNTTLATKLSAGDAYDIVRIQGSWYPRMIISKLLTPLQNAFSTGDCTTDTNNTGIDLEKSTFFAWNDELYAVTTYDDSPIIYMYYNKNTYKQYIGHDPMDLYKQGRWTWEQLKKDASIAMQQGLYYSDYSLTSHHWQLTNGTKLVQEVGGKMVTKLSGNTNYINSLKFVQGLVGIGTGVGIYEPLNVIEKSGGTDKFSNLMSGKILIWPSESDRYEAAYNQAKTSAAFQNNPANLAICPMPLGPDNTSGAYGGGYLTAFGAGRGSDATAPQLVAALCKFHSTYNNNKAVAPTEAEQAVFNKIYKNVNHMDYGYGTADGTLNSLSHEINNRVVQKGEDITKTLKAYDNTAASYLKNCLNSQ